MIILSRTVSVRRCEIACDESQTEKGCLVVENDWNANLVDRIREAQNDQRTVEELVSIALSEQNENAAWDVVLILHLRGTLEVFDAARLLCQSSCAAEQTLGANILGQLGVPDRSFPDESVDILLSLIQSDRDADVLDAACIALGHIHEPRSIPSICNLASHSSTEVRYAVAYALGAFADELAIETLLSLVKDPEESVRDWAMFALGSQCDVDTPEIRDALLQGTADRVEVVRGEALVGLANRHDDRVIEPIIRELLTWKTARDTHFAIDAAEAIASPQLLLTLLQIKEGIDLSDTRYDDAIRLCSAQCLSDKEP